MKLADFQQHVPVYFLMPTGCLCRADLPKPPQAPSSRRSSSSTGDSGGGGGSYTADAKGGFYVAEGHGWIDPEGQYHP